MEQAQMSHELTDLQARLLPMLEWYHAFCVEHGLRYYILGGTMLGAVRHQGFIPWDDDIDVGMPRRDYEEFSRIWGVKKTGNMFWKLRIRKQKSLFMRTQKYMTQRQR